MAEGCDIFIHWRVCYDHIFRRSDSGVQPLPLFFFIIRRWIRKEKANKNIFLPERSPWGGLLILSRNEGIIMARQIFIVNAFVVDANGTFNNIQGYPKTFDSRSYQGDIDKTQRRAEGDLCDAGADMCKIDTRQVQTATLSTVDGFLIERKTMGGLVEPEPNAAE